MDRAKLRHVRATERYRSKAAAIRWPRPRFWSGVGLASLPTFA